MDDNNLTPEEQAELDKPYTGRIPSGKVDLYKAAKEKQRVLKNPNKYGQVAQVSRFDLWFKEFLANGGNATKAAMKVGNHSSYASASDMGSYYLKKAKQAARLFMEENGATYGDLLKNMIQKNQDAKTPEWNDRLLKIAGYADFMSRDNSNQVGVVNIISAQQKILSEYGEVVEGVEVEEGEDELD